MKKLTLLACAASLAAFPLSAQEAKVYPAPGEIVAAAKADEWVGIAPSDLLVMDLAPDAKAKPRRVVIQLIPAPFSEGWVSNIRKLAAAKWWDGTSINRVQDNYVVQWGDATEKKALPDGLAVVPESQYANALADVPLDFFKGACVKLNTRFSKDGKTARVAALPSSAKSVKDLDRRCQSSDAYAELTANGKGFPFAYGARPSDPDDIFTRNTPDVWPTHCYGMVGVGRNLSPDTGSGAELYTVIGHAPRHLDRNIALVGRVIEGIENLSSLPRGTGALGFYESEAERVPILSVRMGTDAKDVPAFEYLSTESASFAAYADARANRRDAFFNIPAGGADICNIPVPIRRKGK
jgi:cyclophilin family peptidyl-prolyl cis-trans isomerase